MSSILIIYGSTSGNTEMVCEKVLDILKQKGHTLKIQRVEKSRPEDITKMDVTILASPTYGHGVLQEDFVPFWKAMKKIDLKGHPCAVIGLGDAKYDAQYHIESAHILEEVIKKAGGSLICPALRISRSPVPFLESRVAKWAEELSKIITSSKQSAVSLN